MNPIESKESSLNCPIEKYDCNKCDFYQKERCLCPEEMTQEKYAKLRKSYIESEEFLTPEGFVRFISRCKEIKE